MNQIVGVGLSLTGAIVASIGVDTQTYFQHLQIFNATTQKSDYETLANEKPYYCQTLWVAGFTLVVFGSICEFVSLGYAAQSIIVPIWCVGLIGNVVFSNLFLGDVFSKETALGIFWITAGIILSIVFGSKQSNRLDFAHLIRDLRKSLFVGYIFSVVFACLILYGFSWYAERIRKRKKELEVQKYFDMNSKTKAHYVKCAEYTLQQQQQQQEQHDYSFDQKQGWPKLPNIFNYNINTSSETSTLKSVQTISYSCLGGIFGGHAVLCLKIVMEFIVTAATTDALEISRWLFWVAFFLAIALILTQLHFLALATRELESLRWVSFFQGSFILSSVFSGIVYFDELSTISALSAGLYFLGLFLVIIGSCLLLHQINSAKYTSKHVFTGTLMISKLFDDVFSRVPFKLNDLWMNMQEEKRFQAANPDVNVRLNSEVFNTNSNVTAYETDQTQSQVDFFGEDSDSDVSSLKDEIMHAEYTFDQKPVVSFLSKAPSTESEASRDQVVYFESDSQFGQQDGTYHLHVDNERDPRVDAHVYVDEDRNVGGRDMHEQYPGIGFDFNAYAKAQAQAQTQAKAGVGQTQSEEGEAVHVESVRVESSHIDSRLVESNQVESMHVESEHAEFETMVPGALKAEASEAGVLDTEVVQQVSQEASHEPPQDASQNISQFSAVDADAGGGMDEADVKGVEAEAGPAEAQKIEHVSDTTDNLVDQEEYDSSVEFFGGHDLSNWESD